MNKPVRLDPLAVDELTAAEAWYEEQAGLGSDFVAAVREAGNRIADRPQAFPLAPGVPALLGVRRCPVRRFPYRLCFIELADEIRVLAVAHNHRRPGYWLGRAQGDQ